MNSRSRSVALVLVAVGLLLALLLLIFEGRRRQALYWYDVRQDYDYEFSDAQLATVPVPESGDDLLLPDWNGRRRLAVLGLRVRAKWSGWWFEPCIRIHAGPVIDRQCFERGAKGLRYLLLPEDVGAKTRLKLEGEHLRWSAQSATLWLFERPDPADARVAVLAPHPDDAEIAAFGVYSTRPAYVITMTAGNYVDGLYSSIHADAAIQDALRGEVRSWDSLAVPLWGGVPADRVVNLGYLTHSLAEFYKAARADTAPPPGFADPPGRFRQGAVNTLLGGRPAAASWDSVVADLVAVLEAARPDVVVSPHPAMDSAADHQYTTIAMLEALTRLGDDSITLWLYTNHHTQSEHFPFGPSDTSVTLPPWFGSGRFASLHSYRLDESRQMAKLFALEAMHDLRGPPLRLTGGPAKVFADRLRQAIDSVRRDPVGDYSYFRRAVRPNELFFVYPPESRTLLADFLPEVATPASVHDEFEAAYGRPPAARVEKRP